MPDAEGFEGARVLVTGAAGGFGRALARAFAARGASLILCDLDAHALADAAAAFDPARVAILSGDVAREETHRRLVELSSERFGGLDVAVNNAGIVHPLQRLETIEADLAARVLAVDLLGVVLALQHQISAMAEGFAADGRVRSIVNIASIAGLKGAPHLSVYAAAKHGVVGLTRSAALENARRGIRINAVCPAFARTAMVTGAGGLDAGEEERLVRGVPMRRLGEVEEVVGAVLHLADPRSGFTTGVALPVDGGLSAL
ncbi:SDR family oxidoreductase [Aurantimonas sp. Leaf443]|uniref:SDR family NAD(P)-dependent oxidoreductase n=1 Tax=Aurantimonas sp. Leaf443 TaxID=1736378 RepID=UPI000701F2BF|nr:SDR family oxidoreductase [Aurantimonas sp. Leaf443]KQT85743.1 oxidoreductase [Aurantimonas sp. Leaf443]